MTTVQIRHRDPTTGGGFKAAVDPYPDHDQAEQSSQTTVQIRHRDLTTGGGFRGVVPPESHR